MITNLALPTSGKMNRQQVRAYRSLLAFQLRATNMQHGDIAKVLNLRRWQDSKALVELGRRTITDAVIGTVAP